MKRPTEIGMNRTGMDLSKILSKEMIENMKVQPDIAIATSTSDSLRGEFFKAANSMGTVPIPGTIKGTAKTVMKKLIGERPEVLIDKLGERLAFERTGTRLYELMLVKCEADEDTPAALIRMLRNNYADEERHFHLIHDTMKDLGADPTAITPSADSTAVMSMGLIQTLSDPRSSVVQGLEAILTAELVDQASWELLIRLLEDVGIDDYNVAFEEALESEERHLLDVRSWHSTLVRGQAMKKDLAPPSEESH